MVRKKSAENKSHFVKIYIFIFFSVLLSNLLSAIVSANTYVADLSFVLPDGVYSTGERVEIKGSLFLKNYTANGTLVTGSLALANAVINLTIKNATANITSYNFTTDASGIFYSRSDFYTTAPLVTAPSVAGDYVLRAVYVDLNNVSWFSEVGIQVINSTIDQLRVSTDKASYNPSESMEILAESLKITGDRVIAVSNITVNGSVRNSTSKGVLSRFNCTTGTTGKCTVLVNAPSNYGNFLVELNDFKAYSGFNVVPFFANMYIQDGIGKGYKNTFALGEQASVVVGAVTNSTSDVYTFSGYIADIRGNVVKSITSTTLNSNNSYTNKFVFTVDSSSFAYGAYYAKVTVSKQGDGSIDLIAPFEVDDWTLTLSKEDSLSGFEYDYSTFSNKILRFEIYPKYRVNGSIIPNITAASFLVNLTDKLNNNLGSANVSWNASCGKEGCYKFNITSPTVVGQYNVVVTLSYGGSIQDTKRVIYVIDTIVSAQSTNADGDIKELFGTNEFVYLSLRAYNTTAASLNLSDAEVFLVTYMNGTDVSYTNVSSFALVNASNTANEWAWNSSLQRLKLDAPKSGGIYRVVILAQNRTAGSFARFIVNPYDICSATKNTPGQVSGSGISGGNYYYVSQFKTTDTVYFELKIAQANNPLGRATFSNFTSSGNGSQYGMGSECVLDTQKKQGVTNATVSIVRVINTRNSVEYALNTTQSVCVANDNAGKYTCTAAPAVKWDGGSYGVEMKVVGLDGSSDIVYGFFEARAFYLYGYSNIWQSNPTNNITLTVRMYEAGRNWWSNYGSGGLAGTVTVEKVEYMGKDGEWIWPPVDSGYNVSRINTTTLTTGSGTITLPVSFSKKGSWDSGNYRIVLKGTDSSGNVDYGYAWFSVKLWDVYGMPMECTSTGCQYKSYFNSKENITLFIKIGNAGAYSYSEAGGQSLGGNVSITVKKIQDCRTWPCKELNASEYISGTIIVNGSSGWYWNLNTSTASNYFLKINKSDGRWGTGWYSVILNVNGTETGYAWFNTIAFYVDARPTDINGTNWKYNIKPSENSYYNVTATKNYRGWNVQYNASDYLNVTLDDALLRTWDPVTYQTKEYNYPEDINISIVNTTGLQVSGNALLNLSYRNGSWPTGYYWGELIMRNADNETSTGWLWFGVQPFRVEISSNNYEIDSTTCVNTTLTIRDPDWYTNALLPGNYSITSVYENTWNGGSYSSVTYTNYTNTSFNGTVNAQFCPNDGRWGGGSWGGHHNLNILVKDNVNNNTQTGWLSFRTVPFRISWSVVGGSDKRTNENVNVSVSLSKAVGSGSVTGNLSKIYQWRYDSSTSYSSVLEEYSFTVYTNGSSACSSSSGSCYVNGSATVVVNAPSKGWRTGSNYLYSDWVDSAGTTLQDYSGIYINGLQAYNGYFENVDQNGNWKNAFSVTENVTLKLTARNSSYAGVGVNITALQYYLQSNGCYSEWCATLTTATWSFVSGGSGIQSTNGSAILSIQAPSGGWSKGTYSVKATVSGSEGTATINGGTFYIKDFIAPNVTITAPTLNQTILNQTFSLSATTTENAVCNIQSNDYGNFNSSYCANMSSISQTSLRNACNSTYYNFNTTTQYQAESIYRDSSSFYNSTFSEYRSITGISTGGTTHTYTMNITRWRIQDYAINIVCLDDDSNYGYGYTAIHVNATLT